ncbi:g1771 [Coccomyxa elongata]
MEGEGSGTPQVLIGDWVLGNKIGAGSFAVVWRAKHALTGQLVAIKEISTDKLNKKLKQSLESEVSILKQITHKNIVQLLEVIEVRDRMYLVMEYCSGGDLSKYIRRHKRIPEASARALLRQLAAGLRELWSRNLVHRDLKPQNLLLSTTKSGALLKIADFGFARSLQPQGLAETLCGSPLYMAPEILQFHKYNAKADLWSVGTILFELVVGKPPFNGANHVALLRNIERQEAVVPAALVKSLSTSCVSLLHGLLRRNPVERMTFEEFFTHPFLRSGSASPSSCNSSSSSSLVSSAEPSPVKGPTREAAAPVEAQTAKEVHQLPVGPDENLPFLLDDDPGKAGEQQKTELTFAPVPAPPPLSIEPTNHTVQWYQPDAPLISIPYRSDTGLRQSPTSTGRSGPSVLMPSTPQPQHNALGNLLDDEDEYVIIDGPSPFNSTHGSLPRRSATHSGQGSLAQGPSTPGSTPPVHKGSLMRMQASHYHPLQGSRSGPEQPHMASSISQAAAPASSMLFSAGMSRPEVLVRSARILESLAATKQAGGAPQDALSIRLLTVQVLEAALNAMADSGRLQDGRTSSMQQGSGASRDGSGRGGLTPERVCAELKAIVERAEESATATTEAMEADEQLPDPWELTYRAALALAKGAAVDELLGNATASMRSYVKAGTLLYFIFGEAPHLNLEPKPDLPRNERLRLQRYTAAIAARYNAVAALNSPSHSTTAESRTFRHMAAAQG